MESKKYICDCKKEYKTQSGLSKHKNKCSQIVSEKKELVNTSENAISKEKTISNKKEKELVKSNEKPIEKENILTKFLLNKDIDFNQLIEEEDDDDDDFEIDSEYEKILPDIYKIIICKLLEQNKELKENITKLNNKIFELCKEPVIENS